MGGAGSRLCFSRPGEGPSAGAPADRCLADLPGELVEQVAVLCSPADYARLCCVNRRFNDLLSLNPALWSELRVSTHTAERGAAVGAWLERRRQLVSVAHLDLFCFGDVGASVIEANASAALLARALSGSTALQELKLALPDAELLVLPGLELPALRKLSLIGPSISLTQDFSCLTSLEAATILGFSLGTPDRFPGVAERAFPPSLRALTFAGDYLNHMVPPAILAVADQLEELCWLSVCGEDEGLEEFTALKTLHINGAEFGAPYAAAALHGLEELCVAGEEMLLEEFGALQNLTALHVGRAARWGAWKGAYHQGGWGDSLLDEDVPAALLALPRLKVLSIEAAGFPGGLEMPLPGTTPTLERLSLCLATAAGSPGALAALPGLTQLCLNSHGMSAAHVPSSAALSALLESVGTLPRLLGLDLYLDIPEAAGGGGSAGAPETEESQEESKGRGAGGSGSDNNGGGSGRDSSDDSSDEEGTPAEEVPSDSNEREGQDRGGAAPSGAAPTDAGQAAEAAAAPFFPALTSLALYVEGSRPGSDLRLPRWAQALGLPALTARMPLLGHVQLCAALSELNFSRSVEWAAPPSCPPAQRAEQLASFWRDRLGGRRQGGSDSGDEE